MFKGPFRCHAEGFIKDLNGITRLMVYQGTHCSLTSPEKLYYLHMTALPWEQARARVGSSVVIDRHTIDELQVLMLLECLLPMYGFHAGGMESSRCAVTCSFVAVRFVCLPVHPLACVGCV